MSADGDTRAPRLVASAAEHAKADDQRIMAELSRAEVYARAEQKMRRGKRLVISGFIVAVVGIVGYCVACLSAAVNPELGSAFLENPRWLAGPALGVIGLGTLLWLVGSFMHLSGGMDADPDGPDLYY